MLNEDKHEKAYGEMLGEGNVKKLTKTAISRIQKLANVGRFTEARKEIYKLLGNKKGIEAMDAIITLFNFIGNNGVVNILIRLASGIGEHIMKKEVFSKYSEEDAKKIMDAIS